MFKYDNENLVKAVNKVIRNNESNHVIYIQNLMKENFFTKLLPFRVFEGSESAAFVSDLLIVTDYIFGKYKGDAFSNPLLKLKLDELGVDEVELIGIDGGGCIAKTAFGAIKAGYKVTINMNAIGTIFKKKEERFNLKLKELGVKFI